MTLDHTLWNAIVGADRGVSALLPTPPSGSGGGSPSGSSQLDPAALREAVVELVDGTLETLTGALGKRRALDVAFPLVLMFDERVLGVLSPHQQVDWRLLQLDYYRIDDGGDAFYARIDRLLERPDPPASVLEAFYYCLKAGFRGQYAEKPKKVKGYLERLEHRIPTPPAPRRPDDGRTAPRTERDRPSRYYLLALAAAVVFIAALGMYSNL